jgi:hypothetical protein
MYHYRKTINNSLLVLFISIFCTGCSVIFNKINKIGQPVRGTYEDFKYISKNKHISITSYTGSEKAVNIPSMIEGLPVTSISHNAFRNKQLTDITIPDAVTYIGGDAFSENLLTEITLPAKLTKLGGSAFANNQISDIVFPPGITEIQTKAFANNNFTSINIPKGITAIRYGAFSGNPITEVILPEGITRMSEDAPCPDLFPYLAIHGNRPGKYTLKNSRWLCNGESMREAVIVASASWNNSPDITWNNNLGVIVKKINGKNPKIYKHGDHYYLPEGTHTFIVKYEDKGLVHTSSVKDTKLTYKLSAGRYLIDYAINKNVLDQKTITYSIRAVK